MWLNACTTISSDVNSDLNHPIDEIIEDSSNSSTIISLFFIIVFDIFIVVANVMIMVAFLTDSKLKVARNYYIFSLALADFTTGIVTIPLYAHTIPTGTWTIGLPVCIAWNLIDDVCVFSSHMSMLLISYDRYLLVNQAIVYHAFETPKRATLRILVLWSAAFVVKLIGILLGEWYYSQTSDEPSCSPSALVDIPYIIGLQTYDIASTSISSIIEVFIPLVLMIYFNMFVYISIRNKTRKNSVINTLVTNVLVQPISPKEDESNSQPKGQRKLHSYSSPIQGLPTIEEKDNVNKDQETEKISSETDVSAEEVQRKIYQREISQWIDDSQNVLDIADDLHDDLEILENKDNEKIQRKPSPKPKKSLLKRTKIEPIILQVEIEDDANLDLKSVPGCSSNQCQLSAGGNTSTFCEVSKVGTERIAGTNGESQNLEAWTKQSTLKKHKNAPQQHLKQGLPCPSQVGTTRRRLRTVRFSDPIILSDNSKKGRTSRIEAMRRISQSTQVVAPRFKMKMDRKAGITLLLLVVFFVSFKVPIAAVMMILAVCRDCINRKIYEIFTWMFRAKVIVNPFLYAFISQRFRNYYINLFKKLTKCTSRLTLKKQ